MLRPTKKTNKTVPNGKTVTTNTSGTFFTRVICLLITALTVTAVFTVIWTNPLSIDSYTHIAIGEHVLQFGVIPSHGNLSFKLTDPSLEWISHSWLSDVLLYMGQSISLRAGIFIILLPLLALSVYLVYLLLPRPRFTLPNILLLSITAIISSGFWRYQPFIFMIPLQLALMVIISRWHQGDKKTVWFIPLIFVLWANLAGGYIIIPALYCILTGITTLAASLLEANTHPRHLKAFGIAVTAGMLLSLVNPYGARIWMYWLTVIAVVYQNRSFSSLIGALTTYNQTSTRQAYSSLYLTLFTAYSGIIVIWIISSLVKNGRPALARIIPYLSHVMLMMLGYFWVRFIPFSVFILLPLAASAWAIWSNTSGSRSKIKPLSVVGLTCTYAVLPLTIIFAPPLTPAPRTPQQLADVIKDVKVPENILTTYDNTGYIMYTNPEYKMLLDAQDDLIDDGSLITNYQPVGNYASAFQNVSQTQSIHTAIISRDVSGLSQTLASDQKWALIYFDDNGAIFVDRNTIPENKLIGIELKHVNLETNLGFSAASATESARELEAFIDRFPENYFAKGQLATVYRIIRAYNPAREQLLSIPKQFWTFATYTELGRLEAAQGKCKSAETAFQTALSYRNEKNYSRTVLDIAVLYAGCLGDKKKAKHYFQRYNSFLVTANEREKLNALTKQFGIDFSD